MYKKYTKTVCTPPGCVKKILLVMKITTIILFVAFMQVSAVGLAQKVTLVQKDATIRQIFKEINKQTGYNIFWSDSQINGDTKLSVDFKNTPLADVLNICLENSELTYSIEDKNVVIKQKEQSFLDNLKDKAAKVLAIPSDINGTVVDSTGNTLPGATIILKSTSFSTNTYTDDKGEFHFKNVTQGKYTLSVTYIGYGKQEKLIETTGKDITIKFVLYNSVSGLDQVQVIAYGTQSKRFSVGSVSTVTAEDIEKQPVDNLLLALQGQAPGLAITATSGIPGSQVLVQIRGQNTLGSAAGLRPYDQPLFIVDGVPFAAGNNNVNQFASLVAAQHTSASLTNTVGISPFGNIDPADIESITILKDADATAIYGTQGANGVILITTKKGKPGATAFDLNVNTSFNSAAHPVQLMNTQQYLQFRKDAFTADGITPTNNSGSFNSYAPDLTVFDQNKYTNWEQVMYGQNTNNTDVHASLSGGTATNTFLISTGYNRSSYNYPGNFADQRYTLHSNMHHSSNDARLTVDLITDFGYEQNNSAGFGGAQDVVLPPNLPDLLGPSGNLLWKYQGFDLTTDQFYSSLQQPTYLQNYNLNTSFNISYKLFAGLTIGANMGYNRNTTNENSQTPGASQNPASFNFNRQANFSTNTAQTLNIEPQINYKKTIGKGILTALVGATYKKATTNSTYLTGQGYSNDNFLGSIDNATSIAAIDGATLYRYNAGFARINYIYDNEFIVNLTGRRDASSKFGPTNQFGNFGSVGAGWIFSEQKFLKNSLPVLSFGKLTGSYGTSGTDNVADYLFQSLFQPIPYIPTFQGVASSAPVNLYNPNFSWPLKKSLNIALDLGFFNDRLLLNATFYRDRETNQLVNIPEPVQTGFNSVLGNLPATVQNQGFEFSVSSTNIKVRNFSWRTNFNLSFNRNKLIAFPNLASSTYASTYVIGQSTSTIYGYQYKDVNPTTGLFEFYKANGTVTYNPNFQLASAGGDKVAIANRDIKYMGGFGNTFTYKQFSLFIFCQFSSQNAPNYLFQAYNSSGLLGFMYNQPTAVLGNYWKTPGDVSQLQRLASSYSSPFIASAGTSAISQVFKFAASSGVYSDDTYLRVKTVSLAYQLPNALLNKVHIKAASVFVNGQNLLTFTNYKVGDPEQPGTYSSFPVQRVVAFGLNLKF